jgi:general secretion pathway protein F
MPVYEYVAIDAAGKNRRGIVDADSARTAREKLRASGIYPTRLDETRTTEPRPERTRFEFRMLRQRVGRADLVATTRQLATLLSAGLPLVTALTGVLDQVKKPALRRVLSQVRERVNEGSSLSVALAEHPAVFPSVYSAMIHAGESSGTLELVMERLAEFGEQQMAIQRKIQANLAYPTLMVSVGVLVVFFLMTYVIPRITRIFVEMKRALPLPTVLLIQISGFFQKAWPFLVLLVIGAWIAARFYVKTEKGRRLYDRSVLRLPIVGGIVLRVIIARITRTLGTLLGNGVPLLTAMEIVRSLVGNVILGEVIEEARQEISEGATITTPLARGGVFPGTVIQMISVGEQSGNLEGMLFKIADTYEAEFETRITTLTSLLEPVLILALGGLVGFVVLAVLLPIFEMSHLAQ